MFRVNDYVNYSAQGVCKIEDIRAIRFPTCSRTREYYVLKPVHQNDTRVFVPVENQALTDRMRPILSPAEVDRIILRVKDQDMLWISDRKQRSARFQEILSRRDEEELLLLAGCLYRKSREAKGLTAGDAQALKRAEAVIQQEFSFSLQINAGQIGEYIRRKLGIAEAPPAR